MNGNKTFQFREQSENKMNKIFNYVNQGRGIGAFPIFVLAFMATMYFCINAKFVLTDSIPHIQQAADEILPIVIENGKITTPQNTIKEINLLGKNASVSFPFVLDTTQDNLRTDTLKDGVYLTRSYLYTVGNNEIRTTKLTDSLVLPRQDYTATMQKGIIWFVMTSSVVGTLILFIVYYVLVVFYAVCSNLTAGIAKKRLSFDLKLRLNGILFTIVYIFSFVVGKLGLNLNLFAFFIIMIGLQIYTIKKIPAQEKI